MSAPRHRKLFEESFITKVACYGVTPSLRVVVRETPFSHITLSLEYLGAPTATVPGSAGEWIPRMQRDLSGMSWEHAIDRAYEWWLHAQLSGRRDQS